MWAFFRLIRASWTFGIIMFSYLWQLLLQKLFGEKRLAKRWERIHERNAKRLYKGCVKLRGVYIKMGQVLSIMGTFLPAPFMRELEKLQDQVPPQPYKTVQRAVREALGDTPEALYKTFDQSPVAAASLGQVHSATTHEGEHVAVKVLYPNVKTIIRVDLRVIGWCMAVYKRFMPVGQLDRFLEQLRDMLERETDLAHEARCIERMTANFEDDPDVLFPAVHADLSSATVLTMTFMDGVKISDKGALERLELKPEEVADKLIKVFYKQVFYDRYFHADPHPGNFFVQRGDEGQVRLVVLDLGSACPVRDNLVQGMLSVLSGFLTKNDDQVLVGIETMGFVGEGGDRKLLEETVKRYFQKLLDLDLTDLSKINTQTAAEFINPELKTREIRKVMKAVQYPMGWFYVERAALIMFGLSAQLAPTMNTIEVGFPYIMKFLAENPMPVAKPASAPAAAGAA